jgi:hypothetical protein
MLFNFEELITKRFGTYYSLNNVLSIPLQVTSIQSSWQTENRKQLQTKHFQELRRFVETYRQGLSEQTANDPKYSFRAFLVPKVGNHSGSCDTVIEFIKYDPAHPELYADIAKSIVAIKEKTVPIANLDGLLPKKVCEAVSKKLGRKITVTLHTKAWNFYNVRPKVKKSGDCNKDFCYYDEVHNDYVYTQAWVNFLVKELEDDTKYQCILAHK